MSWGTKILILYLGFVAMIVSMVWLTMGQKVDLVAKDYYAQELKYQDRIDRESRTAKLEEQLTWEQEDSMLTLSFPAGKTVSGTVFFFRPSDAAKDLAVAITTDENGRQQIPLSALSTGMYEMQVSWQDGTETYYNEGRLRIR